MSRRDDRGPGGFRYDLVDAELNDRREMALDRELAHHDALVFGEPVPAHVGFELVPRRTIRRGALFANELATLMTPVDPDLAHLESAFDCANDVRDHDEDGAA